MKHVESIKSHIVHAVDSSPLNSCPRTVCGNHVVLMATTKKEVTCKSCLKKNKT